MIDVLALLDALVDHVRRDPELRRKFVEALALENREPLLAIKPWARAHSLGESTVRRAISEGRLPVTRIGRSVRIAAEAVIADRGETALHRAEAKLGLGGRK